MFGYRTRWLLLRPHKLVPIALRQARHAWQRVWRGWDDTVWWQLDSYVCEVCLDSLRKLHDRAFGYPGVMESAEEWEGILNQMIDGFVAGDELLNDTEKLPAWQERHRRWEELHGSEKWCSFEPISGSEFSRFATHEDMEKIEEDMDFWGRIEREREERLERFRRGMNLFTEHFFNLWD